MERLASGHLQLQVPSCCWGGGKITKDLVCLKIKLGLRKATLGLNKPKVGIEKRGFILKSRIRFLWCQQQQTTVEGIKVFGSHEIKENPPISFKQPLFGDTTGWSWCDSNWQWATIARNVMQQSCCCGCFVSCSPTFFSFIFMLPAEVLLERHIYLPYCLTSCREHKEPLIILKHLPINCICLKGRVQDIHGQNPWRVF